MFAINLHCRTRLAGWRWSPVIVAAVLVLTMVWPAARADEVANPKFKLVPACAALVAAAQTNQIPMGQVGALSDSTNGLHPGDCTTVLITFVQKQKRMQWLMYVEATKPDSKDKSKLKTDPFIINDGYESLTFYPKPAPARLKLIGPYTTEEADEHAKVQDTTFFLEEGFLAQGLDQAADLFWCLRAETNTLAKSSEMARIKAEKKVVYSSFPALLSYIDIVQNTKGLDSLFYKLVKLPSLWSMVRNRGISANIQFDQDHAFPANPKDWNLPAGTPVYYLPWVLQLNDQTALKVTLVVTRPRPPYLICGGILGLLAERVGDKDTYMVLRVIDATTQVATSPVGGK